MVKLMKATWPAPTWIRAFTTTRPFNFSHYEGVNPLEVMNTRENLARLCHFTYPPIWLKQTHSASIVEVNDKIPENETMADGAYTSLKGMPCVVLTADCLPLFLCDEAGTMVAALHCGWRGITRGIIEEGVKLFRSKTNNPLMAWLGPAIGPDAFEVGLEVSDQFIALNALNRNAFKEGKRPDKRMADIYQIAKNHLYQVGVTKIYGGNLCTYHNANDFYSFRRDGVKPGMASVIWIDSVSSP